ncbi:MAG: cytochrome D1 domain-containing protein [Opitutaceae bacterium]|nr:cytochrome D1 domain-containing protein [Opitutaceae bacterium]
MKPTARILLFIAALPGLACAAAEATGTPQSKSWLSPSALVVSADGHHLYVACATANRVAFFDLQSRTISRTISVPASPLGLALTPDGRTLYVTCAAPESTVSVVDTASAASVASIPAGHTAMAPVLSPDGRTLYVCNRFNNEVAFIDLAARKTTRRVKLPREPISAAITRDGKFLLVANHLPAGPAHADVVAASVSIVDTARGRVSREIALPNGSGLLRDLRLSPDGRHAIVVHQLARFHLPTSQIERGWINTNAVSLIDTGAMRLINTVLLDNLDAGAANPWGVAWSSDGRSFTVTHAGTHELSVIDFPALLAKLARLAVAPTTAVPGGYVGTGTAADVPNDLSFITGLRRRIKTGPADLGPRAVALVGAKAYLANYFSDTLTEIDLAAATPHPISIPLQPAVAMSGARRGEFLFNDASICFQGWQSCASCHSSDARVDALNWDNLNDGIGNQKNTKSLLHADLTPPSMWLGVRASAEVSVRAGIRNSLFTVQPEEVAVALDEYLQSLDPIPSPHLAQGKLSDAAQRGEKVFFGPVAGCAECHLPPLFTDLKRHGVGTGGKYDARADEFDTPSLVEVWRSGPYLHDGSAATMRDVFTSRNRAEKHGKTAPLTPQQLDDLVEYVLSL